MIIWSVTIVVTIKYVLLVLQADNEGEGGILGISYEGEYLGCLVIPEDYDGGVLDVSDVDPDISREECFEMKVSEPGPSE